MIQLMVEIRAAGLDPGDEPRAADLPGMPRMDFNNTLVRVLLEHTRDPEMPPDVNGLQPKVHLTQTANRHHVQQ